MTRIAPLALILPTVVAAATAVFVDRETHVAAIEQARAERVARLTAEEGWLTLVGLHFLEPGANQVGSAPDNSIVLAGGPPHLGIVTLRPDGRVFLELAAGVEAQIGEGRGRSGELVSDAKDEPTRVRAGSFTLEVLERGGRKALRIRDAGAARRAAFTGLDYFPIDFAWRIEATWVPFERSRQIMIANILGQVSPALVPGKAVFERDGRVFELLPIDEGPDEPLLFVFSDATSGRETYGAARFLHVERPAGDRIVLDFNLAVNPPCAFTPFATCPLPPRENRLPFAVAAGEKTYNDPIGPH